MADSKKQFLVQRDSQCIYTNRVSCFLDNRISLYLCIKGNFDQVIIESILVSDRGMSCSVEDSEKERAFPGP